MFTLKLPTTIGEPFPYNATMFYLELGTRVMVEAVGVIDGVERGRKCEIGEGLAHGMCRGFL